MSNHHLKNNYRKMLREIRHTRLFMAVSCEYFIINSISPPVIFSYQWSLVGFHRSPCESMSLQFSRNVLADLNNFTVCLVSILPLIWNSSSLFPNFWGLFQVNQIQLVPPSSTCIIVFLLLSGKVQVFVNLFTFF